MIKKEDLKLVFMVMYFIMIMVVSYTAHHSVFVADSYFTYLVGTSAFMLFTTYYIFGFKYLKIWIKAKWFEAKVGEMKRKEAKDLIDRRYAAYNKG